MLRAIDANRDGTLSAEELRLAPIALTAFDLDDDGSLMHEEISPANHAQHRAAFRMVLESARPFADAALMLVLDANHDGVVQSIEVANAASSLRRLDANGDGAITPDELQSAAAETRIAAAGV